MCRRNEISNVKYYSALSILACLLFSLGISTQPRIIAAAELSLTPAISDKTPTSADTSYGKTPLLFEMNKGQTDSKARFISRGKGYTLYLAETEAVFSLQIPETRDKGKSDVLRMRFAGGNTKPVIEGAAESVTKTNYYRGKERVENISNYHSVNYKDVYSGIDAVFYGTTGNQLEYDFVVAPESNADQVQLNFEGAESVTVNEQGDLVIKTANTELVQHKPYSYQEIDGQKREIESSYVVSNEGAVKFALGEYDHSKQLVIDPRIGYLTYFGGSNLDTLDSVKADAAGNVYVTGTTASSNFPTPVSRTSNGSFAVFVSKISPDGQDLIYTTFLDGSEDDGITAFFVGYQGTDIALDTGGNAYISGETYSADFPISDNAYQKIRLCSREWGLCTFGEEAFVTKLNSQGNIVYSTFLGGRHTDFANGIAVDPAGRAYVTGTTSSSLTFPIKNAFQGTGVLGSHANGFLTVFNADGSDILYSTGLGGNGYDFSHDIALDSANNVYITGETESDSSFPTKNAFQDENGGGLDTFVAKFNTNLSGDASLIYSTFLGGAGTDVPRGITVDASGSAHVTGVTGSFNFPLKNPIRSTNQINEAFVTALNSTGSDLVNSTFLGGSGQDFGNDIELDSFGNIYIVGGTSSTDFPLATPFQNTLAGAEDAFVTKLKFGSGIKSSSYLGGSNNDRGSSIAVQNGRVAFVAGSTISANLPTTPNVFQGTNTNGDSDGFIARLLDTHVDSVGVFHPQSSFVLTQSTTNVVNQPATLTSGLAGQRGVAGDWDGDGIKTIGTFSNGTWKVRNFNFPFVIAPPVTTITFGAAGDLPVSGDWNGDGKDTPGIFRPSTGQFTVTDIPNSNPPFNNRVTIVTFGTAGDLPISGDWDGDGKDSIAVYRPSTGETFFTNQDISVQSSIPIVLAPGIDIIAFLGIAEDLPFGGDWNGDGKDSLGLFRPSTTEMILSDDNINLRAVFLFGQTIDQPIAGDWDGKPTP